MKVKPFKFYLSEPIYKEFKALLWVLEQKTVSAWARELMREYIKKYKASNEREK